MRDSWEGRLSDGETAVRFSSFPTFFLPQELCRILRAYIIAHILLIG